MELFIKIIGMLAGTCTTIAFLPQVIQTWKSKSAKGLSLGMFSIFTLGVSLWLVYGIIKSDPPLIIFNAITLSLSALLLYFKLTFKD